MARSSVDFPVRGRPDDGDVAGRAGEVGAEHLALLLAGHVDGAEREPQRPA